MLDTDCYPLLSVEEIFSGLSKIDLNKIYQQVVLAESAHRLLAINARKEIGCLSARPQLLVLFNVSWT